MISKKQKTQTINFENEDRYKIGSTVFVVEAHYDNQGKTIKERMLQILREEINNKIKERNRLY